MKRPHSCQLAVFGIVSIIAFLFILALWSASDPGGTPGHIEKNPGSQISSQFFTPIPSKPHAVPRVREIDLPEVSGVNAIWGGTGRDTQGHIWFGLCAKKSPGASAHLAEYQPEKDEVFLRGDVISALAGHRSVEPDEAQAKIHTKIIQAADGNLYFASLDETGADFETGGRNPKWGSHLWRLKLPEHTWEHIFSADEGLIAITVTGWHVYALGYFGHQLYHYDIQQDEVQSIEVGSTGAHISRNIISDFRGHVYVPRVTQTAVSGRAKASLVEYNHRLQEVQETPLKHYLHDGMSPAESHGLTAFQPMVDGSIVIVTAVGYLYQIFPKGTGPADVSNIGWLHPDGQRYVASLFTFAGRRYIMGLAKGSKDTHEGAPYHWVIRDLADTFALTVPFQIHSDEAPPPDGCLLYGSVTRDNSGRFYVAGSYWGKQRPLALTLDCSGRKDEPLPPRFSSPQGSSQTNTVNTGIQKKLP